MENINWQSDRDMPNRRETIQHIVRLLRSGSPVCLRMAKQLEVSLYRNARSLEDYMDTTTLKPRLQAVAMEASRKARQEESSKMQRVGYVASVEVSPGEYQTLQFAFPNFNDLPRDPNSVIQSPCLDCHGYSWRISLRPGGSMEGTTSEDESYVRVDIELVSCLPNYTSDDSVWVNTDFFLRTGTHSINRQHRFSIPGKYGSHDYLERAEILGGDLTIELNIRVLGTEKKPVWTPKKCEKDDLLQILEHPEWADTSFVVDGKKFPAFTGVLAVRAPTLADLTKDARTDVEISGCVDPEIFEAILRFVYGRVLPGPQYINKSGRALLEAANRFGCHQLKIQVECQIVKSLAVDANNAAEWLLFADSHACPLLKEAAINQFKSNPTKVMESPGWTGVEESAALLSELMRAAFRKRPLAAEDDDADFNNMDVSGLRRKLEEKGLDVDGTREMLVQRLNGAS